MSDNLGSDPNPQQYSPPPPPPPPPAAQQQQWSTGAASAGFDPKSVHNLDWGILACGFLAFIFSFFSYYTATVSVGLVHASASENAWHGFFGWFAMLLALASAGVLAVTLFAPATRLPFAARPAVLIGFGVATLCVIIAAFVTPGVGGDVPGVSFGRGVGYFLSLIVILAGTVLSYLRMTDGKLPWQGGGNPFARKG